MTHQHRRVVLRRRPHGAPTPDDFELIEGVLPKPAAGEVLIETLWLSLDPYMRGRMNDGPSYAKPVGIGDVMTGEVIGRVLASRDPSVGEGALVRAPGGWQSHACLSADLIMPIDPAGAPPQTFVGVLGMPGLTAYAGVLELGRPKAGETFVVAAATGPVGSLAGQLAKRCGMRVVGIAGGPEKTALLTERFGFDAGLDHRQPDLKKRLADLCPDGIDVYVELVGGAVFDAVRPLLNTHARMPVIGTVAHYNAKTAPEGPDRLPGFVRDILVKRLSVQGLIVYDFEHLRDRFLSELTPLVRDGAIVYVEDVVQGLDAAPEAFIGMLEGRNLGKLVVAVA